MFFGMLHHGAVTLKREAPTNKFRGVSLERIKWTLSLPLMLFTFQSQVTLCIRLEDRAQQRLHETFPWCGKIQQHIHKDWDFNVYNNIIMIFCSEIMWEITHHIITSWTESIGTTHIHPAVWHFMKDPDIVLTLSLEK